MKGLSFRANVEDFFPFHAEFNFLWSLAELGCPR